MKTNSLLSSRTIGEKSWMNIGEYLLIYCEITRRESIKLWFDFVARYSRFSWTSPNSSWLRLRCRVEKYEWKI